MYKVPKEIKPGMLFTTTWSLNKFIYWELVDVTRNQACLKKKDGTEFFTHVNDLRTPIYKQSKSELEELIDDVHKLASMKPADFNVEAKPGKAKYCFLDIETSGFSEKTNAICQISMIVTDENYIEIDRFNAYIAPYKNNRSFLCIYTSSAEKIHGLSKKWLTENGNYIMPIMNDFVNFFTKNGPGLIVVGHNIKKFDNKFIASALELLIDGRHYSQAYLAQMFIDTLEMCKDRHKTHKKHSLEAMCQYYGIKYIGNHDGIQDVESNIELLKRLKK